MLNKFKKQMKNEKGLTLIELLAVIVILAIIAAIAVPAIGNIITNSKVNALKADGQNVLAAGNLYFIENSDKDTVTLEELDDDGFIEDAGGFEIDTNTTVDKADGGNTITGTAKSKGGSPTVEFIKATNALITAKDTEEGGTEVKVTR